MERKEFIKTCSIGCLGFSAFGLLVQGCAASKVVNIPISDEGLLIPISEFELVKTDQKRYRSYLIVQNEKLQYPICVYRLTENDYRALLMRCTHQGTELQVFGDKLQCPAHGSEFGNKGNVTNGPASENLRTFPVKITNDQLKILLT